MRKIQSAKQIFFNIDVYTNKHGDYDNARRTVQMYVIMKYK